MIKYFFLFILPLTLFGSKILSYNIYDRTDRVDVMITFDTPYNGSIKKSKNDAKIIIQLQDTSIESTKRKTLSSEFINTLSISSISSYVQIVASVPSNISLIVSKTSDAYGLRLRFTKKSLVKSSSSLVTALNKQKKQNPLSSLPTKKDDEMSKSYYLVVGILTIGIIILFMLKNKVAAQTINNKTNKQSNNWLLGKQNKAKNLEDKNSDVSIRFQKNLDEKNSVVMLDFAGQSYLVMMGTNNVLLDRFTDNKPSTQEDFESILQDRHHALEEFLDSPQEEPMETYKNNASSISYQV